MIFSTNLQCMNNKKKVEIRVAGEAVVDSVVLQLN
jgi:hypothetical protein